MSTPVTTMPVEQMEAVSTPTEVRSTIAIIYCGGTIGMMVNASGALEPTKGYLHTQLIGMPETSDPRMPLYKFKEYDPLLDSSDMVPSDWVRIASDVESLYPDVDGFVILMGTDTMAYCASALSFMLQNLAKPVIVTGGAVPLCEVYNDSRRNLIVSMLFACSTQLCEVCVFFNDVLLRGNRTRKISSQGMDGFRSPNFPPLATLSADSLVLDVRVDISLPMPKGRFLVHKRMGSYALIILLVPGFDHCVLSSLMEVSDSRAFVILAYGLSMDLCRMAPLLDFCSTAKLRNRIVVLSSQVDDAYEYQRNNPLIQTLESLDVVFAGDMTLECVVTKLAFLFGKGLDIDSIRRALCTSLRGELTPHILQSSNFRAGKL